MSKKSIKRKDLQGSGQLPIRNHRLRLHFLVGDLVRKSPFEIQNYFRHGQKGFKVDMQNNFAWYSLIGGARIRMSPCPWCWTWGEEPFDRCWRTCDKNSHCFMHIRYLSVWYMDKLYKNRYFIHIGLLVDTYYFHFPLTGCASWVYPPLLQQHPHRPRSPSSFL